MNPRGLLVFCLLVLVASCGLAGLSRREGFSATTPTTAAPTAAAPTAAAPTVAAPTAATLGGLNAGQIKNLMADDRKHTQELIDMKRERPTLKTPVGVLCSSLLKTEYAAPAAPAPHPRAL